MTEAAIPSTVPIRPGHLGPLDDAPWSASGACDLFPGDERYLRPGLRKRRLALWSSIQTVVDRIRHPQEQVLYVAPAWHRAGVGAYLALGVLTPHYHQVALVLTETRLIEVLLDLRGRLPATRLRSFEWGSVKRFRLRMGLLALDPVEGKKQKWRLRHRGDRRLLERLLPRIEERLLARSQAQVKPLPALHCPQCTAVLDRRPAACEACGHAFRSTRLAAALSFAFPGAGLLYVGHPALAAIDFLAEAALFSIFGYGLLAARDAAEIAALVPVGLVLFLVTKFESMHVGHVLLGRMPAEATTRRRGWRGVAFGGGLLSVAALASVTMGTGSLAGAIDRDLDFPTGESGWRGIRNPAEWQLFIDDPDLRSQWIHEDGWLVSVFAYEMQRPNEMRIFRHEFRRSEISQGLAVFLDEEKMPDGFEGFRFISVVTEEAQDPYALVYYFVYDDQGEDLHQMLTIVDLSLAEHADRVLSHLLEESTWIEAVEPKG
jgi:hypothetical protein